ncbi:MAG: DNA polymerase IV [Alphaproteobacteria bacterium]|nr:DNA polymerase IV [Alphaproteobacteria bacterium]MBU2042271.1 DNA polymerase IV [Alphaproteobacteria bacterium]MBU2124954.1 DNA polymerase IV [Alphaproteobacteria bacterium]MBU2209296.1 DNA polymerase IV [Alphaproteobacteria bacterium]MBU2289763.1 DNA polymerase IV [Alphaproteobacteria bacterium]
MKSICRDCLHTGDHKVDRCPACDSRRIVGHDELDRLTIAHLDCDAFYASVEKRDRPELRDRPVIVGGGKRGVVSTCCYIARQYGVHSAMPMFKALKACPEAVVIKPDFRKYIAASEAIFGAVGKLTPLVQTLSLDEAWIDLAGTERLNGGAPAFQLIRLQQQIEIETGLTVSIGLAPNRFLAKVASELDKPRGFSVLGSEAAAVLAPRPVGILPGVGPVFRKTLQSDGYATVGDLAAAEVRDLVKRYGETGLRLHDLAHGRDARRVNPDHDRKGMSAETTFNEDLTSAADLEAELWPLCEKLASKARRDGVASRVLVLKLRRTDFKIVTRRVSLPEPVQTARALFAAGRALMAPELGRPYRLVGIGMAEVVDAVDAPALFESTEARVLKTETAIDRLRAKFGDRAVVAGRALKD